MRIRSNSSCLYVNKSTSLRHKLGYLFLLLLAALVPAGHTLTTGSLFTDRMVLQRGMEIPVWGTAEPRARILITLADREVETQADRYGNWIARLHPMQAGGPHILSIDAGPERLVFSDVLIGEVWLCSGQSNMKFRLEHSRQGDAALQKMPQPGLRLFMVPEKTTPEPRNSCGGQWKECTAETAADFSAVAYYFGKKLHDELGVPIGLIESAWGGTSADAWTPRDTLNSHPEYRWNLRRWEDLLASYPARKENYDRQMTSWHREAAQAEAEGKEPPDKPRRPIGPDNRNVPGGLYNGMIAPLVPYAVRGSIWYQGEANRKAGRTAEYRTLFPAMIRSWRAAWSQPRFHFYFVQLPGLGEPDKEPPAASEWAEIREAQTMALTLPDTAMAVTLGLGEPDDIHPRRKNEVGERLALPALNRIYGSRDKVDSGPLYRTVEFKEDSAIIYFDYAGQGLETSDNQPVRGFALAGADRQFHWAQGRILGGRVEVYSPEVQHPVAVRYAWSNMPDANLVNSLGLPAGSFRTDDWPGTEMELFQR